MGHHAHQEVYDAIGAHTERIHAVESAKVRCVTTVNITPGTQYL